MPQTPSSRSQIISGFTIAMTDSLRYVTTQTVWMRLAGLSETAAVFGRWQAIVYVSVMGAVFIVPHRVVISPGEPKDGDDYRLDFRKLRQVQPLFLLIGASVSVFFCIWITCHTESNGYRHH